MRRGAGRRGRGEAGVHAQREANATIIEGSSSACLSTLGRGPIGGQGPTPGCTTRCRRNLHEGVRCRATPGRACPNSRGARLGLGGNALGAASAVRGLDAPARLPRQGAASCSGGRPRAARAQRSRARRGLGGRRLEPRSARRHRGARATARTGGRRRAACGPAGDGAARGGRFEGVEGGAEDMVVAFASNGGRVLGRERPRNKNKQIGRRQLAQKSNGCPRRWR